MFLCYNASYSTPKWRNWQTRYVQGVVLARECGFDSHLRHKQKARINDPGFFIS